MSPLPRLVGEIPTGILPEQVGHRHTAGINPAARQGQLAQMNPEVRQPLT